MKNLLKRLKGLISETHPLRLTYHRLRSSLTALWYGFPARHLTVIGVTGTDGKTTTVAMVSHILRAAGKRVGAVSTAFLEINGVRESNPTQKTSLPAKTLQRFLKRLVGDGCEYAVIEVSSHGLVQSRFAGIRFEVAAVTNTAMEHLDYHGTMEEYRRAKGMLFAALRGHGTKVLNADDETYLLYEKIPSDRTLTYSPKSDVTDVHADSHKTSARATIDGKQYTVILPIPGPFNLANALCAILSVEAVGIPIDQSIAALSSFSAPPGRMERIDAGQAFSVYVDFAITPQAFERTLTTVRQMLPGGNRILVLTGSCGRRMREKRPIIGRLCSSLADIVVITDDEPYDEDSEAIIEEIWTGIDTSKTSAHKIPDRLEAIRFILRQAQTGDAVLLCGLGSYASRMMKDGPVPWNEQEIVAEELRAMSLEL